MTDLEALDWCVRNNATIHFRPRSRTSSEVTVQTWDDVLSTKPTLGEAVDDILCRRRSRPAPHHDPMRVWHVRA